LDLATGRPAAGVATTLERLDGAKWMPVGRGHTDADGRLKTLMPAGRVAPGTYRLSFDAGAYFAAQSKTTFYKTIPIEFHIEDAAAHFHVPLLLSPFGYSTYRGS
jgi:5-hydroxyisourate hydrolase